MVMGRKKKKEEKNPQENEENVVFWKEKCNTGMQSDIQ